MNPELSWQPLRPADLDDVLRLACEAHPGLPERREVLLEKLALFPAGCRRLVRGGECVGYALGHPWRSREIPPLDAFLGGLPAAPDCLYLHDAVVLPAARGGGAGAGYIELSKSLARSLGLRHLALVSVYGTTALWGRFGFEIVRDSALAPTLDSYGPTARYMLCDLAAEVRRQPA